MREKMLKNDLKKCLIENTNLLKKKKIKPVNN